MNRNAEIAAQFDEIADRQLVLGESWFKVRAYQRAAETMRTTAEDVAALSAAGRLDELPGVGEAITTKTADYLATGHIPLLDRLREQAPDGLLALLRAGLTPAQVRELRDAGIDSPDALRDRLSRDEPPVSKKTLTAARAIVAAV
jgi:DNA polymerase (family 10)